MSNFHVKKRMEIALKSRSLGNLRETRTAYSSTICPYAVLKSNRAHLFLTASRAARIHPISRQSTNIENPGSPTDYCSICRRNPSWSAWTDPIYVFVRLIDAVRRPKNLFPSDEAWSRTIEYLEITYLD